MMNEYSLFYIAVAAYGIGFLLVYKDRDAGAWYWVAALLGVGFVVHTLSIALRWDRLGHGPFINLYEILQSNLWSLMLACLLFLFLARQYRRAVVYLVPVLVVLGLWLLVTPPRDSFLPATYDTVWLYFHVVSGKAFFSLLTLSMAVTIYEWRKQVTQASPDQLPAHRSPGYQLLAFSFVFQSIMLLFGAIWAQDAWGRYWAWDPLETWAFLTWLAVVFTLHWRVRNPDLLVFSFMVGACFVIAFLTFFGVPFISTAPHKGMI